jgi:multidrug transporter EmrE-like cation transporter
VTERLQTIALVLASVILNAAAQIALRSAARTGFQINERGLTEVLLDVALRPGILVGIALYGLSLLTWIFVLSRAEASLAYPFLALGFAIVAIAGHVLLGEALTERRMIAIAIIIGGVVLLSTS